MNPYSLEGKTAVVAGGAGGLGEAICMELAEAGAFVVVADPNEEAGGAISDNILKKGGESVYLSLNVTDSTSVGTVFAHAEKIGDGVNILVNCAGVTRRMDSFDFDEDEFDRILSVNVKGTFLCCREAGRLMKNRGGKIINIASVGGLVGLRGTMGYCASKGAVVQMTKALALDWAPFKINVNAVAPALANTAIAAPIMAEPETYRSFLTHIPLGRLCEPADVALAIRFLSCPASDFITGHILPVDGGWTAD